MSKATKNRFENFMYLDLMKGPSGSCEWITRILKDKSLHYEEIGLLLVLGEEAIGSSFSIEYAFKLREPDVNAGMWFIHMIMDLVEKKYISVTWCKENVTEEDKQDYFEYVDGQLRS